MPRAYGVWDANGDPACGGHLYDRESDADRVHEARVKAGTTVPGEHVGIECGCWTVSGWIHEHEDRCPGWNA